MVCVRVAVGCSCCCAACVASVIARCVCAVVAQLAVDSLEVVFPVWRTLARKSGRGAPGRHQRFWMRVCRLAERACVWCGLHRCRVVVYGTGRSVLSLLAVPLLLGTIPCSFLSVAALPQGLRCAVSLAGAFWQVFPERCLSGSGGGSPRTDLRCFYSSTCCSVLSDGLCCLVIWVVHSGEGSSQNCPLSFLAEVLPRSARCSFRATVVLPLWFEVCCLVGLHSGKVLPGRLLALLVEVLPKVASDELSLLSVGLSVGVVPLAVRLATALASLSRCSFPSFSIAPVGLHVSPWLEWFASFLVPCVLS
ncbi:hypothetical protein Taro_050115, partial [Colocasia esculenta]|nr:hypothetical protein [Colocasia esculenta]